MVTILQWKFQNRRKTGVCFVLNIFEINFSILKIEILLMYYQFEIWISYGMPKLRGIFNKGSTSIA